MVRKIIFIIMLAIPAMLSFSQDEARLLRFPAVYGNQVVFTYAGDLYSVASTGGMARKLTNHEGYEMFARFSPDGKQIAFTGQYDGNTEVFLMPAEGGVPKRLTFTATLGRDDISDRMGPNNIVMTWTPDGKNIIYRSRKQSFNDFIGQLFSVSVNGGLSQELPLPTGGFCSYSPDGKKLAYNRVFREFRTWKYYKGGMADAVWIYDFATKQVSKITGNDNQNIEPMWIGDEIYYLSDRDRTMNMFCYNVTSKQTTKVTNFTEYDIKFASAGNGTIAFENSGYIYLFDTKTKKYDKLTVRIADDFLSGRNELKDASQHINSYDMSPDGERLSFSARGDIYTVPYKSGITRNLTNSSGAHDRDVAWSPDGKFIAYISDKTGEFEIYIQKQDGSEPAIQITKDADTYKYAIKWSPDSKKLMWSDKMLRLQYVDIDTKQVTLIEKSNIWEYTDYDWSPDSKWVTFTRPMKNDFGTICLYNLASKQISEVTDGFYDAGGSVFSRDGKYLLFISRRDFNPIYSEVEWNYAYRDMSKIYLVTLAKATASPFAPENNEVKPEDKSNDAKEAKKDEKKKDEKAEAEKKADVVIDLDGIQGRVIALPVNPGNYWNVSSINDKVYYEYNSSSTGKMSLKMFDLKDKKETDLGEGFNYIISSSGKKMLVSKIKDFSVIDLPSGPVTMKDVVDLSGLKAWVNNKEEWKQIYDEMWRQMRDFFYVSNMHGLDWKKIHDKYAVLVPYVNNRNDLNYLVGEMIGELSIGHSYVGGGDKPRPARISTGLLGAKLSRDASGVYKIDKILKGANWSNTLKSPLTEMGVNVSEGDFILAVNGKSTREMTDIYESLVGTAGKQVELTVGSKADEKSGRKVIVVPVSSEADLYYYNWVQGNIDKVNKATNGEVGYIHIPDMGVEGLNEFVEYFYPQLSKKALIIDDRGNGGGNVSPMIIERLEREVTRANMARNVTEPSQTPRQMMLGPKVLLMNCYSASDGDLFPYGFQKHHIGKVIGTRSWGGVVGIRGSLPIIDGGSLNRPEFASYSSEESKWIIEGHGVDPDIVIDNDPAREYAGEDQQLNKAIDVIKEELKDYKPLPPIPAPPDKSK
ncbi:MAG: PDZ domain-containing protein [Bacteroidia bacterium]|nr:PDZ domain-containing protein [Bacteroidia bacterium]